MKHKQNGTWLQKSIDLGNKEFYIKEDYQQNIARYLVYALIWILISSLR